MNEPSSKMNKFLVATILSLLILSASAISGFTISTLDGQTQRPTSDQGNIFSNDEAVLQPVIPNAGAGDEEAGGGDNGGAEEPQAEPIDVIKNGGFEERPTDPRNGLAVDWEAFSNGQAEVGWYDETWSEAVRNGKHAQLLEIFHVEANILDRVIGIYQTIDVVPNSDYALKMYALMRSDAPIELRNKSEYEMHWGVDLSGGIDPENVTEWHLMPLTEQLRVGSHGKFPEDIPLFYEVITGTIHTGESGKITLFIRGLKKFPTGTEINYDIDEVSLIGPSPDVGEPIVAITPEAPADTTESMPATGVSLPRNLSTGALVLGSLILVVLGAGATASLLQNRKEVE